jgi:hypothetical protein
MDERTNAINEMMKIGDVAESFVATMLNGLDFMTARHLDTKPDFSAPIGTMARHPPDVMVVVDGERGYVEVKHDGKSNETGNIFVEKNALTEVMNFCERVIYIAYHKDEPFIFVADIKKLLAAAEANGHYVIDAGDTAKGMRGRENGGWIVPLMKLVDVVKRMPWDKAWKKEMDRNKTISFMAPMRNKKLDEEYLRNALRRFLDSKRKELMSEDEKTIQELQDAISKWTIEEISKWITLQEEYKNEK